MFAYLNRKLGNISVAAKLALGFAVVLLLTLATTISGWRALDDAIVRSQQLSEIGLINDLTKDLRAERITYRVLNDDTSKARISSILEQLNNMLTTLQKRSNVDESRQLLTENWRCYSACAAISANCNVAPVTAARCAKPCRLGNRHLMMRSTSCRPKPC